MTVHHQEESALWEFLVLYSSLGGCGGSSELILRYSLTAGSLQGHTSANETFDETAFSCTESLHCQSVILHSCIVYNCVSVCGCVIIIL